MEVTYTDRVKQWPEYELIEQATNQLDGMLGPVSSSLLTGIWDWTKDEKNRDLLTLKLKDDAGEVLGKFAPDELRSPTQMSFRLSRLWGDLLQAQSERLLKQLSGSA